MAPMDGMAAQGLSESYEEQFSRFRQIARDFFKNYVKFNFDYLDFIKAVTRFYSIDLPKEINEYIITVDTAPYFWITDIPLITKTEEFFNKLYRAGGGPANYEELKKYYTRWITQKNTRDKQFYTLSALNLLEKDQIKSHFYKKILHANILMFNSNVLALDKALQLLDDADKILSSAKLSDSYKNELQYLVQLYTGFAHFRGEDFQNAQKKFEDAIFIKSSGVSALFYNAVTSAKMQDYDSALSLLQHFIEYDKERFRYALKVRSLPLIEFFLKNALVYNIFYEKTFVPLSAEIHDMLAFAFSYDSSILRQVLINLGEFENLKMEEYFDDFINKHIEFLKRVAAHYKEGSNALTSVIAKYAVEEYNNVLERIIENARKKFKTSVEERTKVYDHQIEENQKKIKDLKEDLERYSEKLEKKIKKALDELDEEINDVVKKLEYKIENIENVSKFNPTVSFKNSMIYNGIISMIVFMITGFSGGFLNNIENYDNFSLVITSFLIAGLKWGGLSYLVGILIALFSSVSTIMEKSSYKQRLMRQLTYYKNAGEQQKEALKKEFEIEMERQRKKIEQKIESLQEDIEFLKQQKIEDQQELNEDLDKKVDEVREKLSPYFLT